MLLRYTVCGLDAELLGCEWPVLAGHDVNEKLYEGVTFGGLVADEVGYLVVDDVEVGYWGCNLFSPHPSPLPRGEGTLSGGFVAALLALDSRLRGKDGQRWFRSRRRGSRI